MTCKYISDLTIAKEWIMQTLKWSAFKRKIQEYGEYVTVEILE